MAENKWRMGERSVAFLWTSHWKMATLFVTVGKPCSCWTNGWARRHRLVSVPPREISGRSGVRYQNWCCFGRESRESPLTEHHPEYFCRNSSAVLGKRAPGMLHTRLMTQAGACFSWIELRSGIPSFPSSHDCEVRGCGGEQSKLRTLSPPLTFTWQHESDTRVFVWTRTYACVH